MHNDHLALRRLPVLRALDEPEVVRSNGRRVDAVVAPKKSGHQLREGVPHEGLGGPLALVLEVLDDPAEIPAAAVLHVQVQLLLGLEVLTVVVGHDVGVAEAREALELGVELLALLLRHFSVVDLLPAEDEAVGLPLHLPYDAERAMA